MSTESTREALTQAITSAKWPDGTYDGFPTRRVAEMIADALLESDWLAAAEYRAYLDGLAKGWDEGYGTALGDFDISARREARSVNPYRAASTSDPT